MNENTPSKVLRGGKLQTLATEKDLQGGDIQLGWHETDILGSSADPLPDGASKVRVLCMGNLTDVALKDGDRMLRVPRWIVLTDGRGLELKRLFNRDGSAQVDPGDLIFPGGAIFRQCLKTPEMRKAERQANMKLAISPYNPPPVFH